MGTGDLLIRLSVAAILGSLIGLERQRLDKAAGLRTHMLVCVSSALVMIVSAYGFGQVIQPGRVVLDPSRVAAQVVSGIGFLGAGSIVVRGQSVHGLTTAASVWAVAAIGLAAGGALYLAATAGTVIMLVILAIIKPLEDRMPGHEHGERHPLAITIAEPFEIEAITSRFHAAGVEVFGFRIRDGEMADEREITFTCGAAPESAVSRLADELKGLSGMREVVVGRP